MITKELIHAEIDSIKPKYLEELYDVIRKFSQSKQQTKKQSLMSKLRNIRIEAAEDFAVNHDFYVIGEKNPKAKTNFC